MDYRVPLTLTPQAAGGYTVTSPLLPELVTEGNSVGEALENVKDALAAVIELYEDQGRSLICVNFPPAKHLASCPRGTSVVNCCIRTMNKEVI